MSKTSRPEPNTGKLELLKKKISEINERNRGLRLTSVEEELDRQELNAYIKRLGLDKECINFEAYEGTPIVKNKVFYATVISKALISLMTAFFSLSTLLKASLQPMDYATIVLAAGVCLYMAYSVFTELRKK